MDRPTRNSPIPHESMTLGKLGDEAKKSPLDDWVQTHKLSISDLFSAITTIINKQDIMRIVIETEKIFESPLFMDINKTHNHNGANHNLKM